MNDMIKKWLFYASLIVFASACLYIVMPKWEYFCIPNKSIAYSDPIKTNTMSQHSFYRYNKITKELQWWNWNTRKWVTPTYYLDAEIVTIMEKGSKKDVDAMIELDRKFGGSQYGNYY